MMSRSVVFIVYYLLSICISITDGTWQKYDLVRPWGGWGSDGTTAFIKINLKAGISDISPNDFFGWSVANIGDVDGDGIDDIAIGAKGEVTRYPFENNTNIQAGGVYILFMNANATFKSYTHLNGLSPNMPKLVEGSEFGYSICHIGDLDNDGIPDIAVGAPGLAVASVYIIYLHRNGSSRDFVLVRGTTTSPSENRGNETFENVTVGEYEPNGPPITYGSRFGTALTTLGDMNEDGIPDIGATAVTSSGAGYVYILYMMRNGTVQSYSTIGDNGVGGGPDISRLYTGFGASMLQISDLDGDGISELVIGASEFTESGSLNVRSGALFTLFMNKNGTAKSYARISETNGQFADPVPYTLPSVVSVPLLSLVSCLLSLIARSFFICLYVTSAFLSFT